MRFTDVGIVHAPVHDVFIALTARPTPAISEALGFPLADFLRVGEGAIVAQIPPAEGIRSGSLRFDLRAVPEGTGITATADLQFGLTARLLMLVMRLMEPAMSSPLTGLLDKVIPELEATALADAPPPLA